MFAFLKRWIRALGVVGGCVTLVIFGAGLAAAFFFGFNTLAHHTNTVDFCISCHEMADGPYAEYKKTIHYANRTGVRASCADCHVSKEFGPKFMAKVFAANDVYHHLVGSIDAKPKFEAKRLELAKRVWARMETTNSRECRTCHDFQSMNMDEQGRRAKKKHPEAILEGKQCISCHKGIVHELPEGYEGD